MENQQEVAIEMNPGLSDAFAAALTQKSNVLESPKSTSFVAEPFIKAPEPENKETTEAVEAQKETSKEIDPKAEVKLEDKPVEVVEANTEAQVEQPAPTEEISEAQLLDIIKQNVPNFNVSSLQELEGLIEESKNIKEAKAQLAGLSQEERARIEIGREHGDFTLYDRIIGINTEQLSDKEAVKQKFMLDNFGKSPILLEKQFEKHYAKTYEEDPDEDYVKLLLSQDATESRNEIKNLQADFKERGKIDGQVDPAIAKKQQAESDKLWMQAVDNVLNSHDRVIYDLEGSKINIVMDVAHKAAIQEHMDQPWEYLKTRIQNKEGKFDHNALYEFIMWDTYKEQALKEAYKLGQAKREIEILKEKKGNAEIPVSQAGDAGAKTDVRDLIASGIRGFGIR